MTILAAGGGAIGLVGETNAKNKVGLILLFSLLLFYFMAVVEASQLLEPELQK